MGKFEHFISTLSYMHLMNDFIDFFSLHPSVVVSAIGIIFSTVIGFKTIELNKAIRNDNNCSKPRLEQVSKVKTKVVEYIDSAVKWGGYKYIISGYIELDLLNKKQEQNRDELLKKSEIEMDKITSNYYWIRCTLSDNTDDEQSKNTLYFVEQIWSTINKIENREISDDFVEYLKKDINDMLKENAFFKEEWKKASQNK